MLTETPDLGRNVQPPRLPLNLEEVPTSPAVDGARRSRCTCSGAPSNLHIERHQPVAGGPRLLTSLSLTKSHSLQPFSLFTEASWPCCALSEQYHGPSVTLCQESRTEESRSGGEVDRRQSPISARRASAGCVRGARARSRQVHHVRRDFALLRHPDLQPPLPPVSATIPTRDWLTARPAWCRNRGARTSGRGCVPRARHVVEQAREGAAPARAGRGQCGSTECGSPDGRGRAGVGVGGG